MSVPRGPKFWENTQKGIVKIVLRKIDSWRKGGFKAINKMGKLWLCNTFDRKAF